MLNRIYVAFGAAVLFIYALALFLGWEGTTKALQGPPPPPGSVRPSARRSFWFIGGGK